MNKYDTYNQIILNQIPLILSQIDRDEMSPTFGCCDRLFWQWKFIDYSCARFQDMAMPLAYVYSEKFDNNIYFQNRNILKWIESILSYWNQIQNTDGSFDEAYPYERSFVATGFSLFYISEAYFLVTDYLSEVCKETLISAFNRAGKWLLKTDEDHAFISNHRLGTATGLYNLYLITENESYKIRSFNLWNSVKLNQSKDGWFSEYGGADIGYLTQGIYYASLLYKKSQNSEILDSLNKAIEFIQYFVHPDGTLGGEYGSRNTEFYFAGGFEILSENNEIALSISKFLLNSLESNIFPNPQNVDRYNQIPLLSSLIHASLNVYESNNDIRLPFMREGDFVKDFSDFKLLITKIKNYYNIIGFQKNGVVKSYSLTEKKLIQSSVGVFGEVNGKILSSQNFQKGVIDLTKTENKYLIQGSLYFVNHSLLNPIAMVGFRIYCLVMRYIPGLSRLLKKMIVSILISKKKKSKGSFLRTLTFCNDGGIKVETKITGVNEDLFSEKTRSISYHMGSSKYYNHSDLYV